MKGMPSSGHTRPEADPRGRCKSPAPGPDGGIFVWPLWGIASSYDEEIELRRLLDWKIAGSGAPQDPVHITGYAPEEVTGIRSIGHQATGEDTLTGDIHRGEPMA
jgi:hypothetical protein